MTLAQYKLETENFLQIQEDYLLNWDMDGYFVDLTRRIEKLRNGDLPSGMLQELKSRALWRAVFAEFIATMVFLFIATMAAVPLLPVEGTEATIVKNALASGLMIAICIQMFGHVSGAFMNPAVTISFAVGQTISPLRALFYVMAQCTGGSLGVLILKGVTPSELHGNLGMNMVNTRISAVQGFACEVVFTFILVISIYGCIDSNRTFFGSEAVGIGFTIAGINLAGIPFTGASMNPARSFCAAFISNSFDNLWVYWAGPILGGSIGALAYKYVFNPYKNIMTYTDAARKLMSGKEMVTFPIHDLVTTTEDNGCIKIAVSNNNRTEL
ncbi:lens fiber major intrinsic protein-like [Ruditapes philippinarum]|uniref:lens fiber major intrinsic protein-like n=1 Tax=Ruditapes philippinarum TaxID=129788 RepID=UPI00295A933B|nr:lens fiber major intrinsic protein-like [Ruditapes philippinarum]